MSLFLPNINTLPDHHVRAMAELHQYEPVAELIASARDITDRSLRTLEGVPLYRAQGAAEALHELETLLREANELLTRR